jgi:hypothetical protein
VLLLEQHDDLALPEPVLLLALPDDQEQEPSRPEPEQEQPDALADQPEPSRQEQEPVLLPDEDQKEEPLVRLGPLPPSSPLVLLASVPVRLCSACVPVPLVLPLPQRPLRRCRNRPAQIRSYWDR